MTTQSNHTRDSFIFYRSFYHSTKRLSKEDKAELFDAICAYALDGELIELSAIPDAIFSVIQPNLDANRRRWENGCKDKKKPSKDEAEEEQKISKDEASDKQTISKSEGNKDKDKDVNVDKDVKSKSKIFAPPSLQQIQDYCAERKNSVSAVKFFDYYTAGNWKDAKGNPVKNWKQKLLSWEGRDSGNIPASSVADAIAAKLNQIAGGDFFQRVELGDQVQITCAAGMKSKVYDLSDEIKNKIKAEFKQPINIK